MILEADTGQRACKEAEPRRGVAQGGVQVKRLSSEGGWTWGGVQARRLSPKGGGEHEAVCQ